MEEKFLIAGGIQTFGHIVVGVQDKVTVLEGSRRREYIAQVKGVRIEKYQILRKCCRGEVEVSKGGREMELHR